MSLGPCVEHAVTRSRELLGYGLTLDDVRAFAVSIAESRHWPSAHPRADLVPIEQARPGDLVLMRASNGSGHLGCLIEGDLVEDKRQHVGRMPLRRLRRLVVQVWRPKP